MNVRTGTASVALTEPQWRTIVDALQVLAENYRRCGYDTERIETFVLIEEIKRLALS